MTLWHGVLTVRARRVGRRGKVKRFRKEFEAFLPCLVCRSGVTNGCNDDAVAAELADAGVGEGHGHG